MTPPGLEEFCLRRGRALVQFAWTLTRDLPEAEDLVQSALAAALPRWHRIDSPEAYVRTSIVRAFVRSRRRRNESVTRDGRAPDSITIEAYPIEDRDALLRLLRELAPRQRAVLVLRYLEQMDDEEIAAMLGVTRATVRTQAARALERLRALDAASTPAEEPR